LGVVNGDPDVAGDLCEVITGVSVRLRAGVPVEVPALLLSNRLTHRTAGRGVWHAGEPRIEQ